MKYLREKPKRYLLDACKMAWYPEKLDAFMRGERITPVTLDIAIHKSCNMRCIFCYGEYQKPSQDYIPTDKLLKLADDAGSLGVKGIAIIGDGENTLNKGLYQFVEALTKNGVKSALATNGLLLTNDKTEILTQNCTWLRFTICAIGDKYRKIHRAVPKGSFDKLVKTISHAVKNKRECTVGLQVVLVPQCFDQIIPLANLALDLGVDYIQFKQYSDGGEGMPMHFDMIAYDRVKEDLRRAENMSTEKTQVIIKWKAIKDSRNITMEKKWPFKRCIDLPFLFQVSGNGKCYPCGNLFNKKQYCYGDLKEQRLKEIISGERYWGIVKLISKMDLKCLCNGQCRHAPGNEFMETFIERYNGDAKETIAEMCGGMDQYQKLLDNPPKHLEFV